MVRRTKEEAQETRKLIMEAASRVFQERGVGHTTLTDIAAAAGVTRGAIYWHFENKSALLHAMKDAVHLPLEAMNEVLADPSLADPMTVLRESALNVLRQTTSDEQTRRVFEILNFKCEYVGDMAEMLERQRDSRRGCLAAIAENLRHAVDKGQLPQALNVEQAAIGMYAVVNGLILGWLLDPDSFDLVGSASAILDNYVAGLKAG